MGQRISFYKNNSNQELREIIFEQFASYRLSYLATTESLLNEFDEPFGDIRLTEYFNHNHEFPKDFQSLDKRLVDELTSTFIGFYCDSIAPDLFELFGPAMSTWRYEESSKLVLATKDQDLITNWNFLVKGRSLQDGLFFDSYSNDVAIGYLSASECQLLNEKIVSHFGNIDTMRKSYSLSDQNPSTAGLEFVLTALNELNNTNKGIITSIE